MRNKQEPLVESCKREEYLVLSKFSMKDC